MAGWRAARELFGGPEPGPPRPAEARGYGEARWGAGLRGKICRLRFSIIQKLRVRNLKVRPWIPCCIYQLLYIVFRACLALPGALACQASDLLISAPDNQNHTPGIGISPREQTKLSGH